MPVGLVVWIRDFPFTRDKNQWFKSKSKPQIREYLNSVSFLPLLNCVKIPKHRLGVKKASMNFHLSLVSEDNPVGCTPGA